MNKLYKWSENFRGGTLEGVFVADDSEMQKLYGKDIYFGEVMGKHSEVSLRFAESDFEVLTEDQDFIEHYEQVVGTVGYNPLGYLRKYVVHYSIGPVDEAEEFDNEDEAEDRLAELKEQSEGDETAEVWMEYE